MSDEQIIGVYSTTNPAEIAMLEDEFQQLKIEYTINEDNNLFGGLPLQLLLIREIDKEKTLQLLAKLYSDDLLGSKPLIYGEAMGSEEVRKANLRRKKEVSEIQAEAAETFIKRYWKRFLGFFLIPLIYWATKHCDNLM